MLLLREELQVLVRTERAHSVAHREETTQLSDLQDRLLHIHTAKETQVYTCGEGHGICLRGQDRDTEGLVLERQERQKKHVTVVFFRN